MKENNKIRIIIFGVIAIMIGFFIAQTTDDFTYADNYFVESDKKLEHSDIHEVYKKVMPAVVNISAYLVFIGINFSTTINSLISIVVMGIATSIYLFLTVKRNLREASLIAVWGLVAIAIKQLSITPVVSYSAFFFSLVLLIASGIHAIKNFRTTPIEKLKRGEF